MKPSVFIWLASALITLQACSWGGGPEPQACEYLDYHGVARVVAISQTHADLLIQPGGLQHRILRADYRQYRLQPGARYTATFHAAGNEDCPDSIELLEQL